MDSSNFLGDEVFFNDHNSTINTLVVCNFAWYRPYHWHIPQLSSDVTDGPVRVLNFAELCDADGNKLSRFAEKLPYLAKCS